MNNPGLFWLCHPFCSWNTRFFSTGCMCARTHTCIYTCMQIYNGSIRILILRFGLVMLVLGEVANLTMPGNIQNEQETFCRSRQQECCPRWLGSYQDNLEVNLKRFPLDKDEEIWASVRMIVEVNLSSVFKVISWWCYIFWSVFFWKGNRDPFCYMKNWQIKGKDWAYEGKYLFETIR